MSKKIVINNDMLQQTKSHIVNLFKPPYNPFLDRTTTNYFALQQYPLDSTENPVKTTYNNKNIITNMFLVTEDFITFINRLNSIWAADSLPRTMTVVNYNVTPGNGYITPGTTDVRGKTIVLPLVLGPTGNKAAHFDEYENNAAKGLWGTGNGSIDGIGSTSIQELLLRHLYSLESAKRDIAFLIAELYYGITNSECVAAKLGFIPAKDFNSDNFTVETANDLITLTYPNPIEMATHYDETVHNPNNKNLYLYFPYVTSNAMRPKNIGTTSSAEDGPISIYTGTTSGYYAQNPSITEGRYPYLPTFTYMPASPTNTSYGAINPIQNTDMPVLTNAVWSVKADTFINQAGYTVIQISETGAGGDITFDHTDKIDFIDSLKFIIKAPTVFA